MDFNQKVVVITGGAKGLGRALAEEFYRQGSHLALIDVDEAGLQATRLALERPGQNISVHVTDIADENQVRAVRADILARHQHVDVLVNNAGVSISQRFEQVALSDFRALFAVNFWGAVHCTRHFLPDLQTRTAARLVNVISDFALMGFPGKTTYGSSKSALMGFTHALATELGHSPLRVSVAIPPALDTNIVRNGLHTDPVKQAREAQFLATHGMPLPKAARRMVRQISKGRFRIVVGPMMFWIDLASRLFPTRLHAAIRRNIGRIDFV